MSSQTRTEKKLSAWSIRVRGTVQGVGFRPNVFRLAKELGIKGHVLNDGEGVLIEAWCDEDNLKKFVQAVSEQSPKLAHIEKIETSALSEQWQTHGRGEPTDFVITLTETNPVATNIPSDAATCPECLEDSFSPFSRRFRYPFTNCTNCGPRLSIIKSMPYDRPSTSMSSFSMCADCQKEYDDPDDRRFHAQPNACHACGPKAWIERADGHAVCLESMSQLDLVDAAATLIQRGEIVAVKGIGGFHLACDATNEEAVAKLRARKNRYGKPFALMARDISIIEEYCQVSGQELEQLNSHVAPIVVLERKENDHADTRAAIAASVAPGQNTLGFMLPYTPLHHLMLKRVKKPIVLTSGNISHEPQCISNESAKSQLAQIADYFLLHDREIVNRLDDSVLRVVRNKPVYLRRARGAAPTPIPLPPGFENAPDLLAMGGELKNTFCLLKHSKAIVSQHIGDLEDARTYADYQYNLELYRNSFQHCESGIAVDLHPEYLSSKLGRARALDSGLPLTEIQHHHAHIASCMADNNHSLDAGPVLGVALDGLGFGSDGTFWGGEFLLADYTSFERLGTFKPVALIGGNQAMYEPWRNTYAHIMAEMGWAAYKMNFEELELTTFFESKPLPAFASMLKSGINVPLASSCGRLFDAVAAAIGICREHASYEGQAAIELEAIVNMDVLLNETEALGYPFAVPRLGGKGLPYIEPLAVWQALLGDLYLNTDAGIMAARFHKGLAKAIVHMVQKLCTRDQEIWLKTVALSGGVFQNKILQDLIVDKLTDLGFEVLTHHQVPANDGGIALGQAVIGAASHIQKNKERSHVSWHTWSNS
ncbi:MAG TPA: carbamoyltransferase HypF [Candidatus Melainabacteria bacterium]|nr:carbamoyltransferase HypF [Candidatus Melainabacteria bacterium]HIN63517.1 carbamoyltransferase HypF [Candidatus Obscuribacterales bacterium]